MLTIKRLIISISFSRTFIRIAWCLVKRRIDLLLLFLVLLDLVLFTVALFFPEAWFWYFHNVRYEPADDPLGLLRRTGAVWAAFTLFQLVALLRWRRQPYWLPLVAGIRLTEVFSDWVYLWFAMSVTWYGGVGLFLAPPANALFAWMLIRSYHHVTRAKAN